MTNQTIPKRSEVPEEMTWNLKDMFASDEAWMTEYEAMKAFPAKIAAFQGTLARSAGDLLAWFRLQDEIELRLSEAREYEDYEDVEKYNIIRLLPIHGLCDDDCGHLPDRKRDWRLCRPIPSEGLDSHRGHGHGCLQRGSQLFARKAW